MDEEDF
jgi:hypothetical protein